MLVEKLSAEDRAAIQRYIHLFSMRDDLPGYSMAPLEHILRFWDKAKSEYLYHLFGEKFILEKEIEFVQSEDEKAELVESKLKNNFIAWEFRSALRHFFSPYVERAVPEKAVEQAYFGIHRLTSFTTLAKNKYTGDSFEVPLPNGEVLKIPDGCKPAKMIGKIAKKLGIEGFSEFQIAHSQALNQKTVKGTLCLSIHPLDYMTMSDNSCGWGSCMSWVQNGQYRQGTVEMMNSTSVIVAYLKSDKETYRFGDYEWNSKKWRCLFIVEPRFICSVKDYPYHNEDLLFAATDFLCSLDPVWKNSDRTFVEKWYRNDPIPCGGRTITLIPCTNMMYNDFGATTHLLTVQKDLVNTDFGSFCYSGESECMWCGSKCIPCEDALLCEDCEPAIRCCECGDIVFDPYYDDNGNIYCECCWESTFDEDPITGLSVYQEEQKTVYLCYLDKLTETWYDKRIRLLDRDKYNDALWEQHFKIDNVRTSSEGYCYVNINDCTKSGLQLFGIYDEEDLERYLCRFKNPPSENELPF